MMPAALIFFCLPAMAALAERYWNTDTGSLTPFIVLLGGWTLWRRLQDSAHLAAPGPLPVVLICLAAVSIIYAAASAINMTLAMVLCAWAGCVLALWARMGSAVVNACRFPLLFLGLAVPLPYSISVLMTERLRAWMAGAAVDMADALSLDVAIDRTSIFVNQYRLELEAACAGTSSTVSLIAIVLLFGYWYSGRDWRRTTVTVLLAVPIALGANVLRVLALIAATAIFGAPVLDTVLHPLAGLISFTLALVLFLLMDRVTRAGLALVDGGDAR